MQKIINRLKIVHHFLARESFYTLLLATLLGCAILVGRLYLTKTWVYLFLSWNLFLAWVPYLCSLLVVVIYHYKPKNKWLLVPPAALWLLFFPNAPYIITDLIHLHRRWDFPLWYDVGLIATLAWVGCFLAVVSLHLMQRVVRKMAGGVVSWLFVLTSITLSGFGIYLGRILRWNSWDILYSPRMIMVDVVTPLLDPLGNLQAVGMTIMFSAFLFICYLTFTPIRGGNGTSSKGEPPRGQQVGAQQAKEFVWVEPKHFSRLAFTRQYREPKGFQAASKRSPAKRERKPGLKPWAKRTKPFL